MVPAALVAGLVLILSACTLNNQQQASNSPDTTPSTAVQVPPVVVPPVGVATPSTAPSPSPTPPPSPAKLIISSLPFHLGEVAVTYSTVTLVAKGGVPPYKWSLEGGALPPGLALSSGGKATGKPTTVGTYSFVVRVDDSAGAAAGAPSSIFVFRQIAFVTKSALCAGNFISACTVSLRYSGGVGGTVTAHITAIVPVPCFPTGFCPQPPPGKPPYTPPSGFTASGSGGTLTVSEPANCNGTCGGGGYWRLTLVLTDSKACVAGYLCTSSNTAIVDVEMQAG